MIYLNLILLHYDIPPRRKCENEANLLQALVKEKFKTGQEGPIYA